MTRTYTELSKLKTFKERFDYLKLNGKVGAETFGYDRYLNQIFYRSSRWRAIRNEVILRDNGCDLGMEGYDIPATWDAKRKIWIRPRIFIHHMNALRKEDIEQDDGYLINPEYLITTTLATHNAIHYGADALLTQLPKERTLNDMCPWK